MNNEEFEVLEPKTEATNANTPFADLLAGYKEAPPAGPLPLNTTATPVAGDTSTPPVMGTPIQPPVEYYKTGKKAGQPKPTPKVKVHINPTQQNAMLSGDLLTGALFITLIDLILPILIVGLNNRFSKDKMKVSDLQLTASQKKELAPIADKVVKQMNIEANPNMLLICSLLGIYGANFAVQKFSPKPQTPKPDEKTDSSPTQNQNWRTDYYNVVK